MKHILKTLSLAIIAIMTIVGLSSCNKNDDTVSYRFEYINVSFDSVGEYSVAPETRFNLLKQQLESMIQIASNESTIISMAEGQIIPANYRGINATIILKKGSIKIKEWKIEAKNR